MLREYQASTCKAVRDLWNAGVVSVCVVAPTGAGKTEIGMALASDDGRVFWLAHRIEIVDQTVRRLRSRFGNHAVGIFTGARRNNVNARIVVGTVQALSSSLMRNVSTVVLDEAHHYVADAWLPMVMKIRPKRIAGLTATPERSDGKALGDLFESIVVSTSYSALLRDGYLVPARVITPIENVHGMLAQDIVESWEKYGAGTRTFVFVDSVHEAHEVSARFRSRGHRSAVIDWATPARHRKQIVAEFKAGLITILVNVNTLTEGIDVVEAETAVLARPFNHVGTYLQAVGRVLRPSPAKKRATVIDLVGAHSLHGSPTDDREYSLEGCAITVVHDVPDPSPPRIVEKSPRDVLGVEMVEVQSTLFVDDDESWNEVEQRFRDVGSGWRLVRPTAGDPGLLKTSRYYGPFPSGIVGREAATWAMRVIDGVEQKVAMAEADAVLVDLLRRSDSVLSPYEADHYLRVRCPGYHYSWYRKAWSSISPALPILTDHRDHHAPTCRCERGAITTSAILQAYLDDPIKMQAVMRALPDADAEECSRFASYVMANDMFERDGWLSRAGVKAWQTKRVEMLRMASAKAGAAA